MTPEQLRRSAARAAVTAAVVGVPADLYHFTIDSRAAASGTLVFRLHGLALVTAFTLLVLALAGIVLAQQGRAGRLGAAGGLLALLGTCLVVGDLAKEAFALPLAPDRLGDPQGYYLAVVVLSFAALSLGWLLTALAARRAGVADGPAAGVLVVGALLAFPPLPGAYVVLLLAVAVVAVRLPQPARAVAAGSAAAQRA